MASNGGRWGDKKEDRQREQGRSAGRTCEMRRAQALATKIFFLRQLVWAYRRMK